MKRGKREVKRAYGLGRRFLAMFLAMVMCTSMLQLTAFATTYKDQVMKDSKNPDYFTVDENGVNPTDAKFVQDGVFTLKKEIEQTGKDAFEITLTVQTSEKVTTNAAAIQLVIDTSSSMNICTDCDHTIDRSRYCYDSTHSGTDRWGRCDVCHMTKASACADGGVHEMDRLTAVKNILAQDGGFLDKLAEANTGAINVSVVTYDLSARTMTLEDKVDASNESNWINIKDSENLEVVKDAILNLTKVDNGTNTDAGLKLANNRLKMDEVKNAGVKYTVLLTDGYANCVGETSTSTSSISLSGSAPRDTNETTAGTNGAKAQVKALADLIGKDCVYVVGYGVTEAYLQKIVTTDEVSYATAIAGENTNKLSEAFANIAKETVEGMSGAGTTVTDPMGQFITMDFENVDIAGVTDSAAGLTWELDPTNKAVCTQVTDKETGVTTYTYTITYPITLNTAAEGFKEFNEDGSTKYYPTNGRTFLSVPQTNGPAKEIEFLVPGVCGEIPEYNWTVEYYLEKETSINLEQKDKIYALDDTDEMRVADLHTTVYAPADYEDYKDGYTFAKGDMSTVITADESKNVIRLYYNLDVAPVTVKHYYKTTTITPEGVTTEGSYEMDPTVFSEFAVVGKAYEAKQQLTFGGKTFVFDKAEPDQRIHISANNENLIEMYYSRVDDLREEVSAQVDHVYNLSVYEVNPETGKYELVEKTPVKEEKVQYSEDLLSGTVYDVSTTPVAGREGYTLDPTKGDYADLVEDGMSFVLSPNEAENIRTLYFNKTEDPREAATVTVEHYYTKNITAIVGGEVVHYNDPDGEMVSETFNVYKGERFKATEANEYEQETYNSAETNDDKLVIDPVEGGEVIKLYYNLSKAPKQAEVVANHYWRTFTEVTIEKTETTIDEEGNEVVTVVGTDTEIREKVDHKIEGIIYNDLYEGQKHVEVQKSWGEGYTFDTTASNPEVYAGQGVPANMYYDKYAEDDERRDADITVHHIYTTYLTTIVDGEVKTLTIQSEPVVEPYPAEGKELKAGDEFVAKAQPVYQEITYTQITDDAALTKILQPGTNATIVINYERQDDDRTEADYTVDYEYRTYTMTINEAGVAGYWDAPAVTTDTASGEGYVGQKVILDAKAVEGFDGLASNPATEQYLTEGENHYEFVYEKYDSLAPGSVTVNHHYKTITIAVNGAPSENTQTVYGTPVTTEYLGETFVAEAVLNGFEQTGVSVDAAAVELAESVAVTVGEATVIDFYYEKTKDHSVPATYSIAHEYYLYDWDGTPISESKPTPVTGTGFATNLWVVGPEVTEGYELVSATYNGAPLENYNITLQAGENVVVFRYEQRLARDFVEAKVIHNFYKDEAAMNAEGAEPEKWSIENVKNLPEGSEFSAEQMVEEGYIFHSSDPEPDDETGAVSIIVTDEGENVIIMNYIRDTAQYEVIHIYNRNGVEEGRTSAVLGGLDGDQILAEEIDRVPEYEGRTYTFQSISGDLVLNEEEEQVIVLNSAEKQTVILVYNRKVSSGGGGGGGTIIIPEPPVPLDPQPEPEVEIPEEDVPLVEIPEEEVPLVDVPKTGDASALWMLMSVLSGTSLAGVTFLGRKKKEEE